MQKEYFHDLVSNNIMFGKEGFDINKTIFEKKDVTQMIKGNYEDKVSKITLDFYLYYPAIVCHFSQIDFFLK